MLSFELLASIFSCVLNFVPVLSFFIFVLIVVSIFLLVICFVFLILFRMPVSVLLVRSFCGFSFVIDWSLLVGIGSSFLCNVLLLITFHFIFLNLYFFFIQTYRLWIWFFDWLLFFWLNIFVWDELSFWNFSFYLIFFFLFRNLHFLLLYFPAFFFYNFLFFSLLLFLLLFRDFLSFFRQFFLLFCFFRRLVRNEILARLEKSFVI